MPPLAGGVWTVARHLLYARGSGAAARRYATGKRPLGHVRALGDTDGELALGVGGAEGLERLGRAVELVGGLDGHLE